MSSVDSAPRAVLISRTPLYYRGGADRLLDRAAHVRAGSSLAWFGQKLVVIQDDSNFVALIDPRTGIADAVILPAGPGGARQFDDARGNKSGKFDLEACVVLDVEREPVLLAFGSGSMPQREIMLVVKQLDSSAPYVKVLDASPLYRALRESGFGGSQLNVEGVIRTGDIIRLFARGNGMTVNGLDPLNATCDLHLAALLAYLERPGAVPVPVPHNIVSYQLGTLDGLSIGFTDAAIIAGRVLFSGAAENSPDVTTDGRVAGSVIGWFAAGRAELVVVEAPTGERFAGKIEGLVGDPADSSRLLAVIDADDPNAASELCAIVLRSADHSEE